MRWAARAAIFGLGGAFWLTLVGLGFARLMVYERTPGDRSMAPSAWPANSRLLPQTGQLNLLIALHPRCPCSTASVEELATLLSRNEQPIHAIVLFYKPSDASADWARGELWRQAERISGVELRVDEDGVEAECFGARTSGHAVLYSENGQLLFSGGITEARGEAGDNPALAALCERICGGSAEYASTPVFGCSLRTPTARTQLTENR